MWQFLTGVQENKFFLEYFFFHFVYGNRKAGKTQTLSGFCDGFCDDSPADFHIIALNSDLNNIPVFDKFP